MESANIHHQQLHQGHHRLVGSSTLATPCVNVGNNHALTSNPLFRNSSNIYTSSPQILFSDLSQKNDIHIPDSLCNSALQESGCHSWLDNNRGNAANGCFISSSPEHDSRQYLSKTKEELISANSSSFPKFSDLLNSGDLSRIQEDNEEQRQMSDSSEKLLLKTMLLYPNFHVNSMLHLPRGASQSLSTAGVMLGNQGNASQIHPTVNISNLSNMSSGFPYSMDLNLQALDLFSMEKLCARNVDNGPGLVEDSSQLLFTHMQEHSRKKQSIDPENLSSFNNNGVATEAMRPRNIVERKAPQSVSKRQRAESRTSCPPFKVRKEKLGDRIAALQQLVAPFGKTDTASVLMEAIGYIKFLQNQVETLSVPYMKVSPRRRSTSTMQAEVSGGGLENEESKPADLRSRGLCLVPLSCMSYITNDGGGGVWPPPHPHPHPPNFNPGF